MMRIASGLRAIAALGMTLVLATGGRADEVKVPLGEVPKAVMDAVKARFPDATLKAAEKEEEGGKTVFEVALKHAGHSYEVSLKPDGTIVEIEKEIAAKDVPADVMGAVMAKYPHAKFKKAEEVTAGGKLTYEVVVETAKKGKIEVKLDSKGKILETEDDKD